METHLNSQEVHKLAQNFFALTVSLTDYFLDNFDVLNEAEKNALTKSIKKTSSNGQKMLAQSASLVVEESKDSLTKINDISEQIKGVLTTIGQVQRVINIAASIVTLSSAILSKNPESIITAAQTLQETVNN